MVLADWCEVRLFYLIAHSTAVPNLEVVVE